MKFFICKHCGNIVYMVEDKGATVSCCGEKMKELIPGEVDAASEKHVPVYSVENGKVSVCVGEVNHPMTAEHSITWVGIKTKQGVQIKKLSPDAEPETCFSLCDGDEVETVYAYCNLHGLWKK